MRVASDTARGRRDTEVQASRSPMRVDASDFESEASLGPCGYLGAEIRGSIRYALVPRGRNLRLHSVRVGASGPESEAPFGTGTVVGQMEGAHAKTLCPKKSRLL